MAQQLQEARETIAARDAEVAELKSRVEELEKLKQQQSQLIQMKDGELAQVQQQLQAQQSAKSEGGNAGGLFAGLLGALLMALAAGIFWRWQGKRKKPVQRRDAPSFASAAVLPVAAEATAATADDTAAMPPEKDTPPPAPGDDYLHVPESVASAASAAKNTAQEVPNLWVTPSWVGSPPQSWEGRQVEQDPLQLRPLTDDPARVGAWQFPEDGGQAESASGFANEARAVLPDAVPAIAAEAGEASLLPESGLEDGRLTLARTYIELGDEATARLLLQQVVDEGEPVQSSHAQLLLDNLAG